MATVAQPSPLWNWIPYKLVQEEGQLLCKWLYLADKTFSEPFFDETLLACQSHRYNSQSFNCVSTVDDLSVLSEALPSVDPTAFIFHVSRCGSTLLSQLLGLDETFISLAEVPLIDDLLRWPYKMGNGSGSALERALKATIRLHGQKRTGHEKHLFIKLDSWHIFFYQTIRKLYPHVPCVLLYRSPDEVLRSHQKHRGMQAVPGIIEPPVLGLTLGEVQDLGLDEYTAKVLGCYLLQFVEVMKQDPCALLLNYNEGAMPMLEKLMVHTGSECSETVQAKMKERSLYHSKHPGQSFSEEAPGKEIPLYLAEAMNLYNSLEKIRLSRLSRL